jgi:hypothetical protein
MVQEDRNERQTVHGKVCSSPWRCGHLSPQDYQGLRKNPNVTVIAPYGTSVPYVVMPE